MKRPMPSKEELHKLFWVNFETGSLVWKPRVPSDFEERSTHTKEHSCNAWNKKFANKEAFTSLANTYYSGTIFGISFKKHRLLFKMYYGYDPDEIDHIDHNRLNNSISNLRDVSRAENMKNVSNQKSNTSGVRGVGFDKSRNKWAARIEVDRKIYHLGRYDTFEEAVAERRAAEFEYGFHENHGA